RLNEIGVPQGARVGLLLRNRTPQLAAFLACIVTDRCAVAFNPLLPPARLADDVETQAPAILIGAQTDISAELRALAERTGLPLLQLPGQPDGPVEWAMAEPKLPAELGALQPDVLVEMLTSGTTGTPKRVRLNRSAMDESFVQGHKYESGRTDGPALRSGARIVTAPLSHISGIFGSLTTLADGRRLVLLEKFSVEEWVSAVERHQSKVANLPPTALRMILDADVPRERLSSLLALRSGTAPLDPAIIDTFLERYGLPVLGQYGATEFSGGVAGWTMKDFREFYPAKRGSVGRMQPNIEARVVDEETGEVLPFGASGILELRGNQLGDPERWVRTTDRASLDADQFLYIHGRADNAINRGGFKVHPDEVARAIELHPAVKEAVVVGIADRRLGEVPAAAITLDPAAPPLEVSELRAYLSDKLLPYQLPATFKFVSAMPRTPSLKPSAPDIKRLFAEPDPH
ncbi:MAG TPA: fatty acid--CoA ligase family protein, partial [Caulobacteraceae bacterium]|nr:fatty acid--CoA ligase family protein [Caulobacteraceae bacterium]